MPESTTRKAETEDSGRATGGASSPCWLDPCWLEGDSWPADLYPPRRSLLFVLSGPSGAGKDAVIDALKAERYPLHYTVTVTTRPRRDHEVPGVSYHFVSPEEFARLRDVGELLEWANVHGFEYGTPVRQVREAMRAGKDALLKIDVQGAAQVKARVPGCVFIFLGPPSMDELARRLAERGTESRESYEQRLRNAAAELRAVVEYDYVVVNRTGRLPEAVAQVKAIVEAERLRVKPRHCDLG